jgi:hypothetical protein
MYGNGMACSNSLSAGFGHVCGWSFSYAGSYYASRSWFGGGQLTFKFCSSGNLAAVDGVVVGVLRVCSFSWDLAYDKSYHHWQGGKNTGNWAVAALPI